MKHSYLYQIYAKTHLDILGSKKILGEHAQTPLPQNSAYTLIPFKLRPWLMYMNERLNSI